MNFLFPSHKALLIELIKAKIDFILVGGYAVIFHGYLRTTGDMDLWLKPDNSSRDKLLPLLKKTGIVEADLSVFKDLDFNKMIAFHLGQSPERIDFLTKLSGLNFDDAYKYSSILPLGEYEVHVLKLTDLILNKLSSNRMKDKADVEELQKISSSSQKKN